MALTSKYADAQFWLDALDRAIATFAQSGVAVLTADSAGLLNVDWVQTASVAGLAALVSVLTTVAFRGGNQDKVESQETNDTELGI